MARSLRQLTRLPSSHPQISELAFEEWVSTLTSVDSAWTLGGGLVVTTAGSLRRRTEEPGCSPAVTFAETFTLSPQSGGFFVLTHQLRVTHASPPSAGPGERRDR